MLKPKYDNGNNDAASLTCNNMSNISAIATACGDKLSRVKVHFTQQL